MLVALHIKDYVLIDRAHLVPGPAMTALTGETGAGKSILIDALGLATGSRPEGSTVRKGAARGVVSAVFEPGDAHPVWKLMEENGLEAEDGRIILKRIRSADGRTRACINDQPVSVGMLRHAGAHLLEIHGQHDGRGFLVPSAHRDHLDSFAGLETELSGLARLWNLWRDLKERLRVNSKARDAAAGEMEYLRHVVDTLETLDPGEGEEKALAEKRDRLMACEKISASLCEAGEILSETDVDARLSSALGRIEDSLRQHKGNGDDLENVAGHMENALREIGEGRILLDSVLESFVPDTAELEKVEERLFSLRHEARKHGVQPDALRELMARKKTELNALEEQESGQGNLEREIADAGKAYGDLARKVSEIRHRSAHDLDRMVNGELGPLKLGHAVFKTCIQTDIDNPGAHGYDKVEFMVSTVPGSQPGPLKTIASGGELSRFVLAMKVAFSSEQNGTVMVFDEVDSGIGGAVANAVGERLSGLAGKAQVLVVTHSPQVAALASSHLKIEKDNNGDSIVTRINPVEGKERIEEIARMLSGARITDEARAAARRLLGERQQVK